MFFVHRITKYIYLEPKHLGKSYEECAHKIIRESLEGRYLDEKGFLVTVLKFDSISHGLIDNDTGSVKLGVTFIGLFMQLFRGEVLDAKVTTLNASGFFCAAGPFEIFVNRFKIPKEFVFRSDIGEVWESNQDDYLSQIREGVNVRLRIENVTFDGENAKAIATINDAYLG